MRSMTQFDMSGTSRSLQAGFLRCSKWGWLVLLVIALMAPFCAQAQCQEKAQLPARYRIRPGL